MPPPPPWLSWAQRLDAIAQNGLTYATGEFDRIRYAQLRAVVAEMLAAQTGAGEGELLEALALQSGYATPKLDLRGVVFRDGEILLVQERADLKWTLPGGYADIGEAPAAGAAREVFEESGYRVRPVKLLAVYDKLRHDHPPELHHTLKLFFLCELEGGAPAPSVETADVGFFAEDRLPPLSLPRVTAAQLRRMFEHLRRPDLPTDFD